MKTIVNIFICSLLFSTVLSGNSQKRLEKDTIQTSEGKLIITFIGHGSLCFKYNDKIIHVDPADYLYDYSVLPKADIVLFTHQHGDHCDTQALKKIMKTNTIILTNRLCSEKIKSGEIMNNGDKKELSDISFVAVPAYNIKHRRDNGEYFHPRGEGNGYIIRFGNTRVYVAGDTENIPEMNSFEDIDIAFLPMNLPYTMTPEMVAEVILILKPKIVYPYHFGETDTNKLLELLKDNADTEVRIRSMK